MSLEFFQSQVGINRILSQCNTHRKNQQYVRYFLQKSNQLRQFQKKLDTSVNTLKSLQNGEEEQDYPNINSNMAETFFAQQTQNRMIITKYMHQIQEKSKQRNKSLPSEYLRSQCYSDRSQKTPLLTYALKSEVKLNLPNLILKAKKTKLPANASRNTKLQFKKKQEEQKQIDVTYQKLKMQRRKIQQKRRLVILGKVMGQNHRKELSRLWILRKQNKVSKFGKS